MKLLLYCCKSKPYLVYGDKFIGGSFVEQFCLTRGYSKEDVEKIWGSLNGKIVAECDFDIEEIKLESDEVWNEWFETSSLDRSSLLEKSCLTEDELCDYLYEHIEDGKKGYAIHLKNLEIYDKPKELSDYLQSSLPNPQHIKFANWKANYYWALGDYTTKNSQMTCKQLVETFNNSISIKKSPQNMCYCYDVDKNINIIISIHPEQLVQILNGEKTIVVRKKVLRRTNIS